MLFDPSRHEPLTKHHWCVDAVQSEVLSIINDIEAFQLPDSSWPTHPLDAESYPGSGPLWCAYAGAAGTVHALQILRGYGYIISDFSGQLETIYQSYLKSPDVSLEPGLHIGELGILMPAILLQPDNKRLIKRVKRCMKATLKLPFYEITSGQTGMMHAALALYEKTGHERWKKLYQKGAKSLIDHWKQNSNTGSWLWRSEVFGKRRNYYGACHGLVGNANALLQGAKLLTDCHIEKVLNRTLSTLVISAIQEDGMSNWPLCSNPNTDKLLVQWCHGAAGIVTAMARTQYKTTEQTKQLDELLKRTGELVWQAGPLVKGASICHGTAGNGYAFLYLYQRWLDPVWLERARKFAMHSIEQSRRDCQRFGHKRFSLWTGDAGLAIYLYHCLFPEKASIPGLDLF
uniref:BcDNA:LD28247 gene product from transcript CG2061-RA n=1 Tax=Rheinheimera sp. BAL341 TaxID=1708203 RepID=A0A486XLQ5_9GAMM